MDRSSILPLALFVAAAAVVQAVVAAPSVLIVSIDTLRADRLGAYGYGRDTSPNIDRVLTEGARFANARTVEPLTAPALISMVTGIEPQEHAATRNGLKMRAGLLSVPKIFKRRGYATAALVGNWTLRDQISGLGEHFEDYLEVLDKARWFGFIKREATAEDLTDQALAWIDQHDAAQPFFLWVHYVEPHAPYLLQKSVIEQVGAGDPSDKRYRYDTEIAFVDRHIGRLLSGVTGDLITVVVADHGESLGEHGYWGHGRHLYEPSLRVPMGIRWPGRVAPSEIAAPALIVDLGATLLSLAGLPVPDFFQSYDWSEVLLRDGEEPVDRVTYYQAHKGAVQRRDAPQRVRQQGLLELARISADGKEIQRVKSGHRWLFDLEADPLELASKTALLSQASPELRDWLRRVTEGLVRSDQLPPPVLDDSDLEELRALGYID